jgi:hypothetical protein
VPLRTPARLLCLLAVPVLLAGCSAELDRAVADGPAGHGTATSTPSPSPDALPDIEGDVTLQALHLEPAGQQLYPSGHPGDAPPAVDKAAVHRFVGQVADRIDAHLDALQRGDGTDLLATLDTAGSPAAVAAITTDLAGPDAPVGQVTYTTEVAIDGGPRWAHVTVTVTHPDGSTSSADLVFAAGPDGPELIAAGPTGSEA